VIQVMAEHLISPAAFTLNPPQPTAEELATIMELRAEHMQLLESRKVYTHIFEALYNDLVQAWTKDDNLRSEIQRLREDLMSIISPQGLDTATMKECQCAFSGEGATSMQDFSSYLLSKVGIQKVSITSSFHRTFHQYPCF